MPFKRGDVLEYVAKPGGNWMHLNGRIGVCRGCCSKGKPLIDWITRDTPEADRDDHSYELSLVRKIGHIELEPEL